MDMSPRFSEVLPGLEEVHPRYFGKPSEFRRNHDPSAPPIVWESIDLIEKVNRIQACFISGITSEVVLEFLMPEYLEEIRFDGEITQFNFDQLVVPLINLRFLDIHLSSLEHLELDQTLIHLNHLECLEITSTNYSYLHATKANMDVVLDNAIALLGIHFPSLIYLALSVPALYSREAEWTQAIINSMFRHRTTLKNLNLESPYPVLEDANGAVLPDPASAPNFEESLSNNNGSLDQITLTSFHYYALYKTCATEFWRQFLLHQEHLEYCQFWCDSSPFKAASPKVIRNNAAWLHTVALNNFNVTLGPDGTKRPINCLSFQNCVNLKVIFLKGTAVPDVGQEPTGQEYVPDFENFSLMPSSLVKVKIMNILMTTDDARHIVNHYVLLKTLHLENIGEHGNLGLDLEDLAHLIEEDQVDRIDVVAGVNRTSCAPSPGDSGYKSLAKILFMKQPKTWFRGFRNDRGSFEIVNMHEPDEIPLEEDESASTIADHEHHDHDHHQTQHPVLTVANVAMIDLKQPEPEDEPGPSHRSKDFNRSRKRNKFPRSVVSSEFQEVQSIVDRLVDADEANVVEFLK